MLFIHLSTDRHLTFRQPFGSCVSVNVHVQVFFVLFCFNCLPSSSIIGVGLLDHSVLLVADFLRNFTTVLYPGCPIVYAHQQCQRVSVSLHPCQNLLLSMVFIIGMLEAVKWNLIMGYHPFSPSNHSAFCCWLPWGGGGGGRQLISQLSAKGNSSGKGGQQ